MKRLTAYPALRVHLDQLQPKVFALSSDADATPIEVEVSELEVAADIERIKNSKFTSKGDHPVVVGLYTKYVHDTVGALTKTLGSLQMLASGSATAALAEPLPQVDAPAPSPLRIAKGQPLLLLSWQGNDAGGGPRFGVVDATGARVAAAVTGGDAAELAYDRCSQAVLPWRPPAAGWEAALIGDARALRDLAEPARRLADDARRMESESALRAVGERAHEIADRAARCQSIAQAAREAGGAVQSCVDEAAPLFKARRRGDKKKLEDEKKKLEDALDVVRAAVERLQPVALEAALTAALRSSGASGARRYAAGQPLTVRTAGGWRDADVAMAGADGLRHGLTFLEGSGEPPATLTLHPWNHAPRELPHAAYEAVHEWWTRKLRKEHTKIFDALSGNPLDALQQCVAIEVMGDADLAGVHDVRGLSDWLHSLHAARSLGEAITAPGAALLTAPPAAGKTTLISQVVVLALDRAELVPIVIKVQLLQAKLHEAPDAFASHWNWVDAYLCLTERERPEVYRMLRQAMMARRALLLLDGLDEAGAKRTEIEQHIVEVLAPQGHVMLCTSRPAGVVEALFSGFRMLKLAPLTEAQQEQALLQRLGNEGDVRQLMTFVERMPTSTDPAAPTMQHRVTANPLMLSMVASVFEIRKGLGMPKTVAELYASASDAMLARGGVVTAEVRTLLEVVFFEAHVAQARVITDVQLLRAALGAFAPPGTLTDLDAKVANPFKTFKGRPEKGHYVELLDGEWKGQRGVIVGDDKSGNPYKVKLADGTTTGWLNPRQLASSGLDAAACRAHMDAERILALLDGAVQALRDEERAAVAQVRERVGQDRLPLLSLLQVEPLQMQSAHLSFQEFFAAQAICTGKYHLPDGSPPPWQWPSFWANAVTLGSEMGDGFGRGLLRAAGVTGDTLDLSQKLGGDPPTVRIVLAAMMKTTELKHCSLLENSLDIESATMLAKIGAERGIMLSGMTRDQTEADFSSRGFQSADAILIGSDLQFMAVLTELSLSENNIGAEGAIAIAEALKVNAVMKNLSVAYNNNILGEAAQQLAAAALCSSSLEVLSGVPIKELREDKLTELNLSSKGLGPTEGIVLAELIKFSAVLTKLFLYRNNIGDDGAKAIAEALKVNAVVTTLYLHINGIGDEGAIAISEALKVNAVVTTLALGNNNIGAEGAIAIAEALKVTAVVTTLSLHNNSIGDEGAIAMAEALKVNAMVTTLSLEGNNIGNEGAIAIAEALKVTAVLTILKLGVNEIGAEGAIAIAEALKFRAKNAECDAMIPELEEKKAKAGEEASKAYQIASAAALKEKVVLEMKACIEVKLAAAEPALVAAAAALDGLTARDLNELMMLQRPPSAVEDVFAACICLLQTKDMPFKKIDTSWQAAKAMMRPPPQFLATMLGFKARIDSGELPKSNFANIQDLLKLEHFNVDFMRRKSSAAARLTDFIININVYNDIVENVEPMHLHLQALEQANQATAELDTVTKLWLGNNYMGDAGKQAVQDAVKGQSGFQLHL
jgi:Ran GTPase-activating protein (RanGAP) involved in mRNA processing and transport